MARPESILRPQPRLDLKWLKTDLETTLNDTDALINAWNSLILDGEVTGDFSEGLLNSAGVIAKKGECGKFYCNQRVLTCACCDGICGPLTGCNCHPCQKLDLEETLRKEKEREPPPNTGFLLEKWAWTPQTSKSNTCHLYTTII